MTPILPIMSVSTSVNSAPKTTRQKGATKSTRSMHFTSVWSTYIQKVLKQVHPDTGITGDAKNQIDSFLTLLSKTIINDAVGLVFAEKKQTVSARVIQSAVRRTLPGELLKHAVSEGTKAVTKLNMWEEENKAKKEKKEEIKTVTMAHRSGLQFPPSRFRRFLNEYKVRTSPNALVYMAAVIEYIAAELLELGGNVARDNKKLRITIRHVYLVTANDEEIGRLFDSLNFHFLGAGIVPCIPSKFLKSKEEKKKLEAKRRKNKKGAEKGTAKGRRFLPGTKTLLEVKKLQRSSDLLIQKTPFIATVKYILGQHLSGTPKLGAKAALALQMHIESTVVELVRKSLLITVLRDKTTLSDEDVITTIRILYSTMLVVLPLADDASKKQIKKPGLKRLCMRAGAIRVSKNVPYVLRGFIEEYLTMILVRSMVALETERRTVLTLPIVKNALASMGVHIAA